MTNNQSIAQSALTSGLRGYLSDQSLYALCREQLTDACYLIDQCCLRIQAGGADSDFSSLCIKTTVHEESIFQYASTDHKDRLAHWVRQYSNCNTASEQEAHTAYIMACAVKALGILGDWMREADQKVWVYVSKLSTDWRWDFYCDFVETQVDLEERIDALDQYALHLEPIISLQCLINDELRPIADRAIKNAIRTKGGIISGIERAQETRARDAAITNQGRHYSASGMSYRDITSKVHSWLEQEVAKPPAQRPRWIALETEKTLSRKSVEAILKRNFVV
ncbi:hypothetical protein A1354_20385 [Pseudomonas asplenii]|nr:hypothetical protein [Pseudomonas asplenii]PNG43809.1 hypothetical protein A1354_20385 [Pseudomonas asplenii]